MIGEPVSGTKDALIRRILDTWESHNRDLKDLLEMMELGQLGYLCQDYKIEDTGNKSTLIKRILKAGIIEGFGSKPVPSSKVSDFSEIPDVGVSTSKPKEMRPSHEMSRVTKRALIWGGILGAGAIIGLVLGLVEFYDRFFPAPAEARLTLSLVSPDANQIPEVNPDKIQFASETSLPPITTELTLRIDNIGNAPANNVCVEFYHMPQSNNWFDHHRTEVIEGAVQDRGSNRGCQPLLKQEDDAIRIKYFVTITPSLAEELRSENPRIGFNVTYDGDKTVTMPLRACFDEC